MERHVQHPREDRLIPIYKKADVIGLQTFLREEYGGWAGKGKNVEIWENLNDVVYAIIGRYVPHKILRLNSDPEY
jgi:hypothetical protein